MFYPREWTLKWQTHYCESRFEGVELKPYYLVDKFHFNDLSRASRILFANGLNDGWSVGSILDDGGYAPDIRVINFPNGAHHSELLHFVNPNDTEDIKKGHVQIKEQLESWLNEMKKEQ